MRATDAAAERWGLTAPGGDRDGHDGRDDAGGIPAGASAVLAPVATCAAGVCAAVLTGAGDGGAATPGSCGQPPAAMGVLLAMLDEVGEFGLVELERALTVLLQAPARTAAQDRVATLLGLSQLLESELAVQVPNHPIAPVQVPRDVYDAARPDGAPSAQALAARFGTSQENGWSWACRAAWGLLPDGRKTQPGLAWPSALRGRKRPPRADRDLVIASLRACAFKLLRRPSSNVYAAWLEAHRRRDGARRGGAPAGPVQRRATMGAIYKQFPRGWASALAAADITDRELAHARAALASTVTARRRAGEPPGPPTPAQALEQLDAGRSAALGLDERARARLARRGFGELAVSRAAAVAVAFGGSLDWLAELDAEPGGPADPGARFCAPALRAEAKRADVKLEALRARARLDVSGWRAVVTGKREPTLAHLTVWARATRTTVTALTTTERAPS